MVALPGSALFVADDDYRLEEGERVQIAGGTGYALEYADVQEITVSQIGEVWVRCHSNGSGKSFWVPLKRVASIPAETGAW